jgi:Flp pilus assembly pilin Flp
MHGDAGRFVDDQNRIVLVEHFEVSRDIGFLGSRAHQGQGLAEYALILALVAIIAIVSLIYLGSQISDKLHIVGTTLKSSH